MIDTHAHIYLPEYEDDINRVVTDARAAGIERVILPNIDTTTVADCLALYNAYPNYCDFALGLHPCHVDANYKRNLTEIKSHAQKHLKNMVAIGETGLDFYRDTTYVKEQQEAFALQMDWAKAYDLPVIIHCRKAFKEIWEIISLPEYDSVNGVFHSFTGKIKEAQRAVERGYKIGVNGIVTFQGTPLAEMVKRIPLSSIILETDAPYLAPEPHRGKQNEPAYLPYVLSKISHLLDLSVEAVEEQTNRNVEELFGKKREV